MSEHEILRIYEEHEQSKFTPEELIDHQEHINTLKVISATEELTSLSRYEIEQVEYERKTAKYNIICYSLTAIIALSGLLYIGYKSLIARPDTNPTRVTNIK